MNNKVKLFFAGDFCSKPSTSVITVSDELRKVIQSCDVKLVNFEVPLKPNVSLPPQPVERFWQNDDVPDFLRGLGFSLFSIANNHAFDWGEDGYRKTKTALGEDAFGAGTYNEAYKAKIVEVNGFKIGFLALSYAAYTGVFDDVLHHEGLGCAYINDLRVNHDIMETKKQVDYLFVLPHDGIEYIDVPMPETIAKYRDFIEYGADGVIGSHPHCPQGWEVYKGKPIFYSLGNFFFNSKKTPGFRADKPHWYEGLCVVLEVEDETLKYEVYNTKNIDNVKLILDDNVRRLNHNHQLCAYLNDPSKYSEYLQRQCERLAKEKEMPIIDTTFHKETIKRCSKLLLKSWYRLLRKKEVSSDFSLKTLLRNDTRKSLLIHSMYKN